MPCPVCGSCDTKRIYSGKDTVTAKFSDNAEIRLFLFQCRSCKMIFLDRINFDSEKINEAYWKMLSQNLAGDYSSVSSDAEAMLFYHLNKCPRNGKLLEVGCADARLLKSIKDMGWEVSGIEPSLQAVNCAKEKYGIDVLNGSLQSEYKKLKTASFDVIIMWGVIEHLGNPAEALRISRLLLKKGGLLVLYTPNADSIFHRLARLVYYFTFGIIRFPMERLILAMHLMYFTPHSLKGLMNKSSFLVKEIRTSDINLDFIFEAHKNFWWSNKVILNFAKFLQGLSHFGSLESHMVVFAESV